MKRSTKRKDPPRKKVARKKKTAKVRHPPGYDKVLSEVVSLLNEARQAAARSVNAVMTAAYWQVGRRIVEYEQGGKSRAAYGQALVERLSTDLVERFGRGFGRRNLFQMRAFYLAYQEIVQTPPAQSVAGRHKRKVQTLSAQSPGSAGLLLALFPLPWSAYVRLLAVDNPKARDFYQAEALRGGWTIRQLDRQINSQFYERTLLSKNKAAMLTKGQKRKPEDHMAPEEQVKDPLLLEFLDLKDEYSETDLEEALILHLESFLLELGGEFAFIGRQKRLRIGDQWFRVDLLFYHRRLRCVIIIDLKLGKLTHADAGQMHLYLNYAREHWTLPDENPPVGLILCAKKNAAVARYALEGLPNKVLATEYKTTLPDEAVLVTELERTRERVERKKALTPPSFEPSPSPANSKRKRAVKKSKRPVSRRKPK